MSSLYWVEFKSDFEFRVCEAFRVCACRVRNSHPYKHLLTLWHSENFDLWFGRYLYTNIGIKLYILISYIHLIFFSYTFAYNAWFWKTNSFKLCTLYLKEFKKIDDLLIEFDLIDVLELWTYVMITSVARLKNFQKIQSVNALYL